MPDIGELFSAEYGDKRYENKGWLKARPGQTPLIASGAVNNGIYGVFDIPATKEHVISVARTGSTGAVFYHGYPCEVSSDALVLRPLQKMSPEKMLWYAEAINAHRFRFNFSRKATPTRVRALRAPKPPITLPGLSQAAKRVAKGVVRIKLDARVSGSGKPPRKRATVAQMFNVQNGNSYELCDLERDPRGVNYVSRRMGNNGVSACVRKTQDEPFPAGTLSVALSGNGVLQTCLQPSPFYTGPHVAVLFPRYEMSIAEKMFFAQAIQLNRFRYGFGRQANRTLSAIVLPPLPKWTGGQLVESERDRVASEIESLFTAISH